MSRDERLARLRRSLVRLATPAVLVLLVGGPALAQPGGTPPYPPPGPPPPINSLDLGAVLVTNSAGWSQVLPRPNTPGALVIAVLPDSPAEHTKVSPGEVVVAIDEDEVSNAERARYLLRSRQSPITSVSLVRPDGSARSVTIELSLDPLPLRPYLAERLAEKPDQITRYLFAQGFVRPAESLALADLVARTNPEFAEAHTLRARSLLALRPRPLEPLPADLGAAVERAVSRSLQLDPLSSVVLVTAAEAYLDLGSPASAESMAQRAVQGDPGSPEGHFLLGSARLLLGRAGDALPRYASGHRA